MRSLQILRLAIIAVIAVAWLARSQWPELFIRVRLNLLWFVLGYVGLTVAIRVFERRRRARRRARTAEGPWTCDVCETENAGAEKHCSRCTVPRPQGEP